MSAGAIATEAHRLLQIPHVAHMVADEREKLAKTFGLDAARIVKELARIALADVRKAVAWSGKEHRQETKGGKVIVRAANDVLLRGSDEIDDETAAAIAEVIQTKDGARIKFHDKTAAIAQLTRILGLTDDTREPGSITIQIVDFSTMPQPAPTLERKEAPTLERMRALQRGRGNG
jgi:phage terminase small subunit